TIVAAGKPGVYRAARSNYHSSDRSGDRAAPGNSLGSDRTARRRAGSYRRASRSNAIAANDRARPRKCGARHRTAQDEPATNSQRQFKSHRGTEGEPGGDGTPAREDFRADPTQDVIASGPADS